MEKRRLEYVSDPLFTLKYSSVPGFIDSYNDYRVIQRCKGAHS